MRYIQVHYDHPRELGYSFRDLDDISRRLGGISFQALITRLGEIHPETVAQCLWTGLGHADRGLSYDKTHEAIQAFVDKGGTPAELAVNILEAMRVSGLIPTRPEPPMTPSSSNGTGPEVAASPPLAEPTRS